MVSAGMRHGRLTRFGGKSASRERDHVDAVDNDDVTEIDESVGEEDVHHRQEERGVGAGRDRDPLVGAVGGAGAAGIDHDDLAAPLADPVDLAHDVGAREQEPCDACGLPPMMIQWSVGGRPGRGSPPAPYIRTHDEVLRPLVDGARRVDHGKSDMPMSSPR